MELIISEVQKFEAANQLIKAGTRGNSFMVCTPLTGQIGLGESERNLTAEIIEALYV